MSEETHPLASILADGTKIDIADRDVYVRRLIEQHDGLVIYTVQDQETADQFVLKIASPSADPEEYERWKKALNNEAEVLSKLKAANLSDRHHLPLLYALSEVRIIADRVEHCYPVGLLTQVPQGTPIPQLLQTHTRLGERTALSIGCQIAQVMQLAHREGYQCGAIVPGRLFWDNANQHVMITDWHISQDIANTDMNQAAIIRSKQDDVRSLAVCVSWLATGQPQPVSGSGGMVQPDTLSIPLWDILDRVIQSPDMLSSEPAGAFTQDLTRLQRYWDMSDLFVHVEQTISASQQKQQPSADLQTMQPLAEQIAIGKSKEAVRPWQRLIDSTSNLLPQPLEQMCTMIVDGQFGPALQYSRLLSLWPAHRRAVLWRRRLAEMGMADNRLATDETLAQYRTYMGQALKAWDSGDCTIPDWLQQLGSLFTKVILTPAAQAVVQRLGYELQIADMANRFEETQDIGKRLEAVNVLDKLSLPDGIDQELVERRKQLCKLRSSLADQYTYIVTKQQNEQQEAVFYVSLNQLRQRVEANDPTLTDADFDQSLRLAPTSESRQKTLDVQSIWQAIGFIHRLPQHGDVAEAIRNFVRLKRLNVTPEMLAKLEAFIAREALRLFKVSGSASTSAELFDRVLQVPTPTYDDVVQRRRWLHALLPAVDAQRRLQYDNLLKQESQIRKYMETLDLPSSPEEQAESLEQLRKLGIVSLQHLYLRVAAQNYLQRQQQEYHDELIPLFEQMLDKLRAFNPTPSTIPASLGDDVKTIREGIVTSKTTGLREKHQQLWDQVTTFAPDFEDLFYQHIFFTAQQAATDFKKLWNTDAFHNGTDGELRPGSFEHAIESASNLHRWYTILADTVYGEKVAAFVTEQCNVLDEHITRLLQVNTSSGSLEQRTQAIVEARQYIAVYHAFKSGRALSSVLSGSDSVATLLARQDPAVWRVALTALPLDLSETHVEAIIASAQDQPLVAVRPSGSYEGTEERNTRWKSGLFLVSAIVFVGVAILVITLL